MKSLSVSERHGWAKYVPNQVFYYFWLGRDYETELMPLAARSEGGRDGLDPLVGAGLDWQDPPWAAAAQAKPLAPETAEMGPPVPQDYLYQVVDAIDAGAKETGKTVPQIAAQLLLRQRPRFPPS